MGTLLELFTGGGAFYLGFVLLVTTEFLFLRYPGRIRRGAALSGMVCGALLIALSAMPLEPWQYAVAGALSLLLPLIVWFAPALKRISYALWGVLVIFTFSLCAMEYGNSQLPTVCYSPCVPIYVIGDSLSAGIADGVRCWPELFEQQTHVAVINLAMAGATTIDAQKQADRILHKGGLVIVEIGGNDLLSGNPAAQFGKSLSELVAKLQKMDCTVLLWELPLPPLCNAYGREQRKVATKAGVYLLPKRFLAGILAEPNGTSDGIHLTQHGQQKIADLISASCVAYNYRCGW